MGETICIVKAECTNLDAFASAPQIIPLPIVPELDAGNQQSSESRSQGWFLSNKVIPANNRTKPLPVSEMQQVIVASWITKSSSSSAGSSSIMHLEKQPLQIRNWKPWCFVGEKLPTLKHKGKGGQSSYQWTTALEACHSLDLGGTTQCHIVPELNRLFPSLTDWSAGKKNHITKHWNSIVMVTGQLQIMLVEWHTMISTGRDVVSSCPSWVYTKAPNTLTRLSALVCGSVFICVMYITTYCTIRFFKVLEWELPWADHWDFIWLSPKMYFLWRACCGYLLVC